MAFQAVPDTASFRVVMLETGTLVEMVNTLYVRNLVLGWNAAHLQTTAVAIGNEWRDSVMPQLQTSVTLDKVLATDEGVEFGVQYTAEYNTAGSIAGTPLSLLDAMHATFRGDSGAPPRRGGLFISGFGEADLAKDTWDATRAGNIQVALQDVIAAVTALGNGDAVVIVSRYSKTANPIPPHKRTEAETNTIASVEVSQFLATQRDRRTGIGS